MIQEAIIDAHTESAQAVGFHATVEQHRQVPFEAVVLGVAVTVKIDVTSAARSSPSVTGDASERPFRFSICHCRIPAPVGWEWIDANRGWARGRC